jgi:hypothetical protein
MAGAYGLNRKQVRVRGSTSRFRQPPLNPAMLRRLS